MEGGYFMAMSRQERGLETGGFYLAVCGNLTRVMRCRFSEVVRFLASINGTLGIRLSTWASCQIYCIFL